MRLNKFAVWKPKKNRQHCVNNICIDLAHNYSVYCGQILTIIIVCVYTNIEIKIRWSSIRAHYPQWHDTETVDKFSANAAQYFNKMLINVVLLDVCGFIVFHPRGDDNFANAVFFVSKIFTTVTESEGSLKIWSLIISIMRWEDSISVERTGGWIQCFSF